MRTLLHLVRKDLRRAAPGLFAWFLLQLTANVALWLVRGQPPGTSLAGTVGAAGSACVILVNLILSFHIATRLVSEDSPDREGGTWRLLPIGPTQLFLSKCASALLCSFLPAAAALLPFAILLGWGPDLAVRSFLALLLCNGTAALLGIGFTPLAIKHVASPVIQVVSAVLVITLGIQVIIGSSSQYVTWLLESRLAVSTAVLLCGLLLAAWLHYRLARRLYPLVLLLLSTALSFTVLATWSHPTLDLLFRRQRMLLCEPLRTECSSTGVSRVTAVLGLQPNQWFDEYSQWMGTNAVEGEMWLGTHREQARLSLHRLPRVQVDKALLKGTLPRDSAPLKVRLNFLHPGPYLGENRGDLMTISALAAPVEGILAELSPVLPSRLPQVYVRPGFSARIRGNLHQRSVFFDFPLTVGSQGSRPGEELRLVRIQRLPDGRLGLEMLRHTLSDFLRRRKCYVVDRNTGQYWELDQHSWTSGAAIGLVFRHRDSMDCAYPGGNPGALPTAGQEATGLDGLHYVEIGDEQLGPASVLLSQEELHEEIPGFSADLVSRYERVRDEVERRRGLREKRAQEQGR
jgi:hypothetical protein